MDICCSIDYIFEKNEVCFYDNYSTDHILCYNIINSNDNYGDYDYYNSFVVIILEIYIDLFIQGGWVVGVILCKSKNIRNPTQWGCDVYKVPFSAHIGYVEDIRWDSEWI